MVDKEMELELELVMEQDNRKDTGSKGRDMGSKEMDKGTDEYPIEFHPAGPQVVLAQRKTSLRSTV